MTRLGVVLAFAAVSCGTDAPAIPDAPGGIADAAGADVPPDADVPDTTPPSLVAVTPAAGGDAWLHEPIRFVFDEPVVVVGASVTANVAGTPVAASVALDADGKTLVVTIDPVARGLGTLEVTVAGGIKDLAGNAFAGPLSVQLVLSAWSRPSVDRGVASAAPAVAVAGSGDVVAAWAVGPVGSRRVVVSAYRHGAWQSLGAQLGAGETSSPAVVLDASSRPVVAWIEGGQAQVERWDGVAWSALPSPGAGSDVALATAPAGGAPTVAVFGAAVAVRVLASNDTWQPLGAEVAIGGARVGEPALAVGAAGSAAIGWIDTTGSIARVRVHRFAGSWTAIAPIVLGAAPPGAGRMSLAARDQTIAVAWDQWAGSFGVLAAKVTGAATTWTQLGHTLDVDAAGDATAPAIALDASGSPIVAWTENIEGTDRGVIAQWNGSAWTIVGGPTWLSSPTAPTRPRLALHAGEAPVVGWNAGNAISVARFNGPKLAGFGIAARTSIAGCTFSAANPPATVLQTGCFTLPAAFKPAPHPGLVPYDIVVELWTDGAKKRRWIALPDGGSMTTSATGAWAAPVGTIVIKEFALETTAGNPATRRAIETRFLVRDAAGWQGFTYRWRANGSDADLQTDGEVTYDWPMDDGTTHRHFYPSRSQCLSCHEGSYGPLLGLRPQQLTRWFDYRGVIADQLPTLAHLAVGPAAQVTPFPSPHDPTQTVEQRTRGYMAANCAHCHNPDHIAIKDLRFTTPLAQTRLCEVIVPGSPPQSRVYQLVNQRPGMPALGTLAVDPLPVDLIGTWISGMTSCP
jgi:hypothetical protein